MRQSQFWSSFEKSVPRVPFKEMVSVFFLFLGKFDAFLRSISMTFIVNYKIWTKPTWNKSRPAGDRFESYPGRSAARRPNFDNQSFDWSRADLWRRANRRLRQSCRPPSSEQPAALSIKHRRCLNATKYSLRNSSSYWDGQSYGLTRCGTVHPLNKAYTLSYGVHVSSHEMPNYTIFKKL